MENNLTDCLLSDLFWRIFKSPVGFTGRPTEYKARQVAPHHSHSPIKADSANEQEPHNDRENCYVRMADKLIELLRAA